MGRIIGLIGGTCVLIAVVRLTNLQHEDHTLRAGTEAAQSQPQLSPRDAYRQGKEAYLRGKYNEALPLLEAATQAASGLTEIDRRNAEEYLGRTRLKMAQQAAGIRAQSPDSDPFAFENGPASDPVADATRTRVERLMGQAKAALKQGNKQEAFKLAQQANQLAKTAGLKFAANEQSPAAMLAQLQGGAAPVASAQPAKKAELPEWADPATGVTNAAATASPAAIELIGAEGIDAPAAPAASPSSSKAQALALVKSARADMKAGRVPDARKKALQAQQLDVAYDLFDDRPELLLAEIDRRSGTSTFTNAVAENAAPAASPAAPAAGSDKQQAARLLELARQDLKNGNLAGAQEKAQQAQQLPVAYKLFEDRPELVMNDIAATQAASNIAQKSPAKQAGSPDAKKQAKELLTQARTALGEGRVDEARQLAIEADRLKAAYGLFDDRPEIILADIARASAKGNETPLLPFGTPATPATPAAAAAAEEPAAPVASKAPATSDDTFALTPQQKASKLLQEARQLLEAGKFDEARAKAESADQINIAYGVFSDRPDVILAEIAQAQSGNVATKPAKTGSPKSPVTTADAQFSEQANVAMTFPASQTANRTNGSEFDAAPIVAPGGLSAIEYYNQGLAELGRGNREAAVQAFQAAHQSGQRLDPVRAQRLQDYLRELAPRNNSKIQLTNRQTGPNLTVAPYEEPSPLDAAAQAESVKFDRLRTETLNAVFRAERLREKDPEQALEIIDRQMAAVEGAELGEQAAMSLMRSLQKTHASLQNEIMQQKPNLDQKRKNEEVLAALERDRNNKLRVEEEFAKLVDEFNTLYEQRRFAEAEVIAKKAKELDPKNPVSETLFWKARFRRRVEANEELKIEKEDSFVNTLMDVEKGLVVKVGDEKPMDFGAGWDDITKRRPKGKYGPDNRQRTDEELRIEESLKRRISLHEDGASLSEVMKKISTLVGINIVFDNLGLEDEGVTSNVPVTIDVDGITVRSALNLMLEPHHLGYMVQDEVLKITSRTRQQGDLVVATYPVADLVIPIPNFLPSMAGPFSAVNSTPAQNAVGGGQMSVPTVGQPFAQIGATPTPGVTSSTDRLGGGAPTADFDTLSDLITSTIAPDSWDTVAGSGAIRHYETTLSLVIRQTQKVHEEIADLLEQLRRLQDLQVTIEVRFVTVSDRFFERIGIDFDFNIQDSVGGPEVDNNNIPLLPFGAVQIPQAGQFNVTGQNQQQGQGQGQNQQQQQAGAGRFFNTNVPTRQLLNRDNYPKNTVVGLTQPEQFSQDLDIPFRQGSFEVGVPTFGGFNPNAGVQMGLAVLSDIEAFFFIQAAQGDARSNLLFAPKVTLFNGQFATVQSNVQRPFVTSVTPTVGFFSAGFTPQITTVFDGVFLSVQAVISADRRFVRLTVIPQFQNLTDVFTFSFQNGNNTGNQQGGQLGQQGQGGGLAGANNQGGGGQFGGGQFGIGGGVGTQQMLMGSMFMQNQNNNNQNNQNGGNNNNAGNTTVTLQQPVVEVVNVTTTVSVPDGGTVLLGGVKRLREGRNMAGVPILNKIPYVSRLFKNTGVGRETESLMLMVTPRIIIQEEEEELLGVPTE